MWLVVRNTSQDSHPQATVLRLMKTCGLVFLGLGITYIKALASVFSLSHPAHHSVQLYSFTWVRTGWKLSVFSATEKGEKRSKARSWGLPASAGLVSWHHGRHTPDFCIVLVAQHLEGNPGPCWNVFSIKSQDSWLNMEQAVGWYFSHVASGEKRGSWFPPTFITQAFNKTQFVNTTLPAPLVSPGLEANW